MKYKNSKAHVIIYKIIYRTIYKQDNKLQFKSYESLSTVFEILLNYRHNLQLPLKAESPVQAVIVN